LTRTSLLQPLGAGIVSALVGFGSSFPIVLAGLSGAGASEAQAASGLFSLSLAMGVCGIVLCVATRMPVVVAWSTPGAALLAATGAVGGGFNAAVGAFLMVAVLIVATGLVRPLGDLVAAIPGAIANAMLAGVLFGLCLAPIKALSEDFLAAALIVAAWLAVGLWSRLFATPAAAAIAAIVVALRAPSGAFSASGAMAAPVFVPPAFTYEAALSIALPLFLVTMASQNLPGLAVLQTYGYRPKPGPLVAITGLFGLVAAPFGGHAVNLAAITAALCASPDASPDPSKRWIAAAANGVSFVFLGFTAGLATKLLAASPLLIEAVAGLALLGAFGGALKGALADDERREAAIVTFLFAASGVAFLHVGGAFWGLVAGSAMLGLKRARAAFVTRQAP
jgi:benzoate membrane transport protein